MGVPKQRDLEKARTQLALWLGAKLDAGDIALSEIDAPAITGKRHLRRNMPSTSCRSAPPSTSLIGGTGVPSQKMSFAWGTKLPGWTPPMSASWQQL